MNKPAFTVTVPNMPGQPADHYEGSEHTTAIPLPTIDNPVYGNEPTVTERGKLDTRPTNDPTDDTYMGEDDPTDGYQEYAND